MKIFTALYAKTIAWSRRRQAARYLFAVGFMESSFFPVPTAIMLAPMVLANRARAFYLAGVATVASVLGGVLGYAIGFFLYDQIGRPILAFYNLIGEFESSRQWFSQRGVWLVLLGGVSPLPYKFFTIAAGAFKFSPLGFIVASAIGRAVQFFLIAALLWWGGKPIERMMKTWGEYVGWGIVIAAVILYFLVK